MKPYIPSSKIAIRDSIEEELSDDIDDDVFIRDGKLVNIFFYFFLFFNLLLLFMVLCSFVDFMLCIFLKFHFKYDAIKLTNLLIFCVQLICVL